jgi:PAS domain S-box-containing protein
MGDMIASQSGGGRVGDAAEFTLSNELLLRLPVAAAYVSGPALVFEFANEEYQRIVSRRELIGRPLREAIPELSPDRLEVIERVTRTGRPSAGLESEIWVREAGHEPEQLFIDFAHQPVKDEAGKVRGVLICGRDVTTQVRDRRRLEVLAEHLSVTEVRHRTLFETLPQGVIHYHADGTILGVNPAASQIMGLPPESMKRWPICNERPPVHEDGSPFRAEEFPVVVAMRTGRVVADVVVGLPHARTGEIRWVRVTAVPYSWDQRGRSQQAYAIITDITDQRRAETALRQSNRLLGRLRDSNVLGVTVSREDGTVLEANDAYLDIIGYSREDLEAGRISWRMLTTPEWAARDRDALKETRLTGACRPYDKEYVHKDGHRVPVVIGSAAIDWNPLHAVTFVVDLTAHQRRELERNALLERVRDARREAETAKERLAFLLQAGDLVGDVQNRGELDHVAQLVDAAASGCQRLVPGGREASEATRAHKALTALNAELDERVRQRTSELIRAEEDRRQLEADLRRSERMQTVGQLTSGIAHDFSNLLAVIVGYAEFAEDLSDQADPELHRVLGEIRSAANRAVHLSSDLLRFSQRSRAKPEPIDLNALIAGIMDLLKVSMRGRAEVIFEPSPTLPAVLSEPGRLEQVLINLAVNARDAMPYGGTVTISTDQVDFDAEEARLRPGHRPGRYVELAVTDTGNGMSTEVKERIFERFFTTKPVGQGTGLGLSTVYGIIKDAKGTIDVDSHEGQGTTFRIYLPAVATQAPNP